MRCVIQRVSSAEIGFEDGSAVAMAHGLLVLVGVECGDTGKDVDRSLRKILGLRIFEADDGRIDHSLMDVGGALGLVPQFTLLADTRRGRRPSFSSAAPPDQAATLFDELVCAAGAAGIELICGRFGARMRLELVNEGPMTLLFDSRSA